MIIPRLYSALTEQEKIEGAGKCLEMWLEIGPACDLNCQYCFAKEAKRDSQMSTEQYIQLINAFADQGGKTLGIPGLGEPFHPANYELTLKILNIVREKESSPPCSQLDIT